VNWVDALPDMIKVGPYDMRVDKLDKLDGTDDFGEYDHNASVLRFKRSQPTAQFAVDTVLHEVNHALFSMFALAGADDEERIVCCMSTGMTMVLRANPDLVKWIGATLSS
jgi:hypothetical protein